MSVVQSLQDASADSGLVEDQDSNNEQSTKKDPGPVKPSLWTLGGDPAVHEEDPGYGVQTQYMDRPEPLHVAPNDDEEIDPDDTSELQHRLHTSLTFPIPHLDDASLPQGGESQCESSSSGRSYSVPTNNGSSIQLLSEIDSDGQAGRLRSNSHLPTLFPWNYEFAWIRGRLYFHGERFNIAGEMHVRHWGLDETNTKSDQLSTVRASPIIGSTRMSAASHDSQKGRSEGQRPRDSESVNSGTLKELEWTWEVSSLFSSESIQRRYPAFSDVEQLQEPRGEDPRIGIAWHQTIERLTEWLLDHYFRSYAPRRDAQGSNSPQDQGQSSSHQENRRYKISKRRSKRLGGGQPRRSSSDKDAEDDSDTPDRRKSSSGRRKELDGLLFACPFLIAKPYLHPTCRHQLRTFSHVKDHVLQKHCQQYCPLCFRKFSIAGSEKEFAITIRSNPECLIRVCEEGRCHPIQQRAPEITAEKLGQILEYRNDKSSTEDHWRGMFNVLFPDDPPCDDPYLDDESARHCEAAERYFVSKQAREHMLRAAEIEGIRRPNSILVLQVYERFRPRAVAMGISLPSNDVCSTSSQHQGATTPGMDALHDTLSHQETTAISPIYGLDSSVPFDMSDGVKPSEQFCALSTDAVWEPTVDVQSRGSALQHIEPYYGQCEYVEAAQIQPNYPGLTFQDVSFGALENMDMSGFC